MKKTLTSIMVTLAGVLVAGAAFAQDAGTAAKVTAWHGMSVAICMGFAAGMGTYGQSKAAAAALEGIARNPQAVAQVQTPMIIAMALMESLVILAFVISLQLLGKI